MICRKCGNPIDENDRFCSKCGARVIKEPLNMSGEQKVSRQDEQKDKKDKNEFTGYVPPREAFNWNVNGFPKEHRKTEDIDFDWNLFEEFHRDMKGRDREKTAGSGTDEIAFAPEKTDSGDDDRTGGADDAKPAGPKLWHQDKDAEGQSDKSAGERLDAAADDRADADGQTAAEAGQPVGPKMWKPDRTAEAGETEDKETAVGPAADIEKPVSEEAAAGDGEPETTGGSGAEDRAETEAFVWSKPVEEPIPSAPSEPEAEQASETDAQTGNQAGGAEARTEDKTAETDAQLEDRAEAKPGDITGAELEEAIFRDAGTPVDEEALKRQTAKIDKFYTFNKKNEEFQRLLDREYEKYNSGRPSDISEEREEISNESRGEMDEEGWLPEGNEQIKEMAAARASLFTDEGGDLSGTEQNPGCAAADEAAGAGDRRGEMVKPEADAEAEEISQPAADEKAGGTSEAGTDEKPEEASQAGEDGRAAAAAGSDDSHDSGEDVQTSADEKTGGASKPGTDEKPDESSEKEADGKPAEDKKGGTGKQTGLTILAVILIIILIMLFIRIIAPDSVLSEKINAIPTLITGEQECPIAVATDRTIPAEDKTGVIQDVIAMNVNNAIDDIIYDGDLKYNSSASYASSDISSSKKLKNNIYQKDKNGSIRYVDETVTGAAIGYASDKLKLGDHMKVFKIGEIRKGSKGYYIWVSENSSQKIFLVIDNGKTMTVSKTYSI